MNAYVKGLADRHQLAANASGRAFTQSAAAIRRDDVASFQQWQRVAEIRRTLCEKLRRKVIA